MTEKLAAEIVTKSGGIMRDAGMTSATPKPRAGEHTPAPWYSDQDGFIYTERDDEDQIVVAKAHEHPRMNATLMNARRIVACVNACDGLLDSELQGANLRVFVDSRHEADAERDELRAALSEALDGWRSAVLHLPGAITSEIDRITRLRAILAKHGR